MPSGKKQLPSLSITQNNQSRNKPNHEKPKQVTNAPAPKNFVKHEDVTSERGEENDSDDKETKVLDDPQVEIKYDLETVIKLLDKGYFIR